MKPLDAHEAEHGPIPGDARRFGHNENLSVLIEAAIEDEAPVVVVDGDGQAIGAITRADLLRAVVEGTETS